MSNQVEQIMIDAMRALRERGTAHRTAITEVITNLGTAMVKFTERMHAIEAAERKLEEERQAAFAEVREAFTQETSTLVLVRDMHPVLVEMQGDQPVDPPKKIGNGGKHK